MKNPQPEAAARGFHLAFRGFLTAVTFVALTAAGPATAAEIPPGGALLQEIWENIPGASVSDLTNSPDYPDRPTSSSYATDLFESPTDILENYGLRMHGYLIAPQTGNYTFWIATDDGGALYLSTDERPANAQLIAWVNGWTPPRQWDWEVNQRSEPVALQAGKAYYVSALMKEQGGGDNLAVRWLMPDGTDQAPIVLTNALPYGVSFGPPVIATHPASTNAVEGGTARFTVGLESPGLYTYQWRRNGGELPGATNPDLVVSPVRMADNGARYRCVVRNDQGSATSNDGVLTVTPDATKPTLVRARNLGTTQVEVRFSEWVASPSALTAGNYRLNQGATVSVAAFGASQDTVILTTSALGLGASYTLTVSNVSDQAQTGNVITANSTVTFTAAEYTPDEIGNPPLAGAATTVAGGTDVSGSGDFGGSTDAFTFAWKQRTGDFDERTRVSGFASTDPFAKAALMARENFAPGSRFAAAAATPATVGCFALMRTTANATATSTGFLPANYPETWLRLKRAGNTFTAYASHDGQAWVLLGSSSISLPATIYLGLASCSRDNQQLATAEFRDLGPVSGGTLVTYTPRGERLGPSSRMTPLVISEIMYHPPERPDGRSGEFVELFNADLIPQDLTGFRLSGSVDYAFPDGLALPAGGFVIVARDPADFQAIYHQAGALGPFANTNSLPNDVGTLQLRNPQGAVVLEVNYGSRAPWPVAADGAGPSLVLARPSYGESDPRAWKASDRVGGSPGQMEAVRANPLASVVINEWLAHTDDPQLDFIELYNHGNQPVDVSRCVLTDNPQTNRFRIPDGTVLTPRGFVAFDQNQLGFALSAAGESLFLFNPDGTRVVDAVRFGAQENGVADGRFPDGTAELRRLTQPTPGAENEPFRVSDVVINEIMYHPISDDDRDEFVELYNHSDRAVDVSGWRFTDGIDYRFPTNVVLPAGGYVVVAKDRLRLVGNYPSVATNVAFGNFDGTLANGGERLALARPELITSTNEFGVVATNRIYIDVDEVTYGTGGRWGQWSDGLGSSLELITPRSDHLRPPSWADSDESAKAPWSTIEFNGLLDNGDGAAANRLQIMLQGPGECLVDDLEVIPSGGVNRLSNPGFESGLTGWTVQGNHRASALEPGRGVGGSNCLHVRAAGRGDTACNRIYTRINPALANNSTATLRAKVRWLKGWPEFLLRTRGSYLEAAGRLALPTNLGTPGAPNSRAAANAGPAIFEVVHAPVLPTANQPVVITARITDPDGLGTLRLRYRQDPNATLTNVPMRDDGTGGDEVAGDGVFSATIPGRSSGVLIAFHLEATDAATANPQTAKFPADAPTRECLVRWGEAQPRGNLGVYRLWQRQADYDRLRSREPLANDNLDCTFAYDDGRVIYNAEMRAKGSPWHGGSVGGDYLFAFPEDDQLLGARDVALVTVGNLGSDDSGQREQAAFWIGSQIGVPALHRRHVFFFENGAQKQTLYEDSEEPNGQWADRWWPDGQDGDLYKIEDWFEFDDGGSSFTFSRDATLEPFTTTGGAYKLARYRWAWRKRAVVDSANNYTNFFNLVSAVNAPAATLVPQVENLVDIEIWMRTFALQHIVGNWDAYGYSRGKNSYLYKPVNDRFQLVPWDIDFVLGSGSDGATTDIFGSNDPTIWNLWNTPAFQRVYLRAFLDAIAGPLQNANFDPIVDGRFAALTANGVSFADPRPIKSWVTSRRNYLVNRIAGYDTKDFAITSNAGNNFATNRPLVTLSGTAPLAIHTITLNGAPVPVTWSGTTTWSLIVALAARENVLTLGALDSRGRPLTNYTDTITVSYTGAELPSPEGRIVISEIMYDPLVPDAEYVELRNTSPTASYDLAGWRLDGVGLTFPSGTVLGPGAYAVVTKNRDAFAAAYGFSVLPVAEFPGSLQDNGERLKLIKPGATPDLDLIVDDVRYDSEPPWPASAHGLGPSLQLLDAAQDNWRAGNWAAAGVTDSVRFTPGKANSVAVTLPAFPSVFINEVQPENLNGPRDRAGDRDPWLELHNPGATAVELTGLYLTADYANLTAWAFPAGTTIGAGEFMVVWADGEPGESAPGELHTNFRLAPTNGAIALVRLQLGAPAVADYINYRAQPGGLSFGSYPDGQPRDRRLFHLATPGGPNNPGAPAVQVFVNEWMASNDGAVLDPADEDPDDWFELYNAGSTPVNLSAYTLTDTSTDKAKFVIPNGTVIPAGGFLLVWADEETGQASPGALHVNFKLAGGGEEIGLYAPDGTPVDLVRFGAQTANVSEGRFPDGNAAPFVTMDVPSPGSVNVFATLNQPPVLEPIGSRTVDEGQTVTFTARAADPDAGQSLTFSLLGAPTGAQIQPGTGVFSWTTTENDGPADHTFTVRVTDNGAPPRWDSEAVTITVREVNLPPVLADLADRTVSEGETLSLLALATDPDRPFQTLRFSLNADAPAGATINETSGQFVWTPTEAQGPGSYLLTVTVRDSGDPALSASRSFRVTVLEVDHAPVFTPVSLQTTDELSPFTLQLMAADPDTPPQPLSYSIETGPTGLAINSSIGLLTWTPTEPQGPSSYNVIVRATEMGGARLSSTLAFSIVVNERNEAPSLDPIPDFTVGESTFLTHTNHAADTDLPAQRLSFSLEPGAPAGASIDPQSGVFTWPIGGDVGPSTNQITVVVTDDAIEARRATRSFRVVVVSQPKIVINEIMYRAASPGAEFVELYNGSTNTAWSLAGWRLTGTAFNFPAGTTLPPGAFLVVAKNRVTFQAAYGASVPVVGDYADQLGSDGGTIELRRPVAGGEEVVDQVTFLSRLPWPTAANGAGPSLQLLDPRQDNNRVANWAAVAGVTTNAPRQVVALDATWRYWQDAADPASGWTNPGYNDQAWPAGKALLYVEGADLPGPKNTPLALGQMSYFFRTKFTFNGNPDGASLTFNTVLDDGAVVYLNGKAIFWLGMAEGEIPARDTASNRTVSDAILEGPFTVAVDNLRQGENVLAVEVHQTNSGSSDIVWGATVDVLEVRRELYTPGYANSTRTTLDPFPAIRINEVLAQNTIGIRDRMGDRDPWIELVNLGLAPASLNGWFLSNTYTNLAAWPLPSGAALSSGGYRLIWADAEPGESTATEWHASFRLKPTAGVVALSRMQNGQPAVVDYLEYAGLPSDQSFGYPEPAGLAGAVPIILPVPTPGGPNAGADLPPEIQTIEVNATGHVTLTWSAMPGRAYRVVATDALDSGAWQDLGGVTATTGEAQFTDTAIDGIARRFYRVLLMLR